MVVTNKRERFISSKCFDKSMKKNFIRAGALSLSMLIASLNNANSQQIIRVIDPVMKLVDTTQMGLANIPVILTDTFTQGRLERMTNSQGYAVLEHPASVSSDEDNKRAAVFSMNNKVIFSYYGNKIRIFNILGQEINELRNENNHGISTSVWNFTNKDNVKVASGVYFFNIYNNNDIAAHGKINYVPGMNEIGVNVENISSEGSKKHSSYGKNTLEKMAGSHRDNPTRRYKLEIRDEITPALGEFFDIVQEADSISQFRGSARYEIPANDENTYEMIYNFGINHPVHQTFLHFFKYASGKAPDRLWGGDGDTILLNWYRAPSPWNALPWKIFRNRASAPLPVFNEAVDSILAEFENRTNINYRNRVIPRQTLFRDTLTFTERGINMDYTTTGNAVSGNDHDPPPGSGLAMGPALYRIVYINRNNFNFGTLRASVSHEFKVHALPNSYLEPFLPEGSYPIPEYRIHHLLELITLKNFTNLNLYKEE